MSRSGFKSAIPGAFACASLRPARRNATRSRSGFKSAIPGAFACASLRPARRNATRNHHPKLRSRPASPMDRNPDDDTESGADLLLDDGQVEELVKALTRPVG